MEASTINPKLGEFGHEHGLINRAVSALYGAGADSDFWAALATDPIFARRVYEFFLARKNCTEPKQAARIMGSNMHGLGPARRHFVREIDRTRFRVVPFRTETLDACRDSHVLVAVTALSVDDIEAIAPKWGYQPGSGNNPEHSWLFLAHEKNASVRPTPGWYLIRKQAVGLGKTFDEATALLGPAEFVPSLAVLVQAMLLHFHETGGRLYHDTHVWASDIAPPHYTSRELPSSISIWEKGLHVSVWSGEKHPTHGLASAVKWETE